MASVFSLLLATWPPASEGVATAVVAMVRRGGGGANGNGRASSSRRRRMRLTAVALVLAAAAATSETGDPTPDANSESRKASVSFQPGREHGFRPGGVVHEVPNLHHHHHQPSAAAAAAGKPLKDGTHTEEGKAEAEQHSKQHQEGRGAPATPPAAAGRICYLAKDGTSLECKDVDQFAAGAVGGGDDAAFKDAAANVEMASAAAQAAAEAAAEAAARLLEARKLEEQLQEAKRLRSAAAAAAAAQQQQQGPHPTDPSGGAMATGLSRSSDFALLSAAELDVLVTRIEQLEAAHAALQAAPYRIEYDYESQSLLEALGDQVKRFVVTRLTPRTDRECAFSFARWRCEPRCACRAQYKLGDYWPSRMCRRVKPEDRDPDCAPDEPDPSDEPVLRRVGRALRRWAGAANAAYRQHLAAPSDADCAFDLARLRCTPSERCAYQFRWWDVTPSQSCRLRLDGGGGGSGAAAAAGAGGGGGSAGGRGQWQGDGEGWRGRDPRGDDEGYREL